MLTKMAALEHGVWGRYNILGYILLLLSGSSGGCCLVYRASDMLSSGPRALVIFPLSKMSTFGYVVGFPGALVLGYVRIGDRIGDRIG